MVTLLLIPTLPLDLHPGNIICHMVKDKPTRRSWFSKRADRMPHIQMTLIDAGLIVEMNKKDRRNFVELFSAILRNDGERAGRLMVERSRTGFCLDDDAFAQEIKDIVTDVHKSGLNFRKVSVSELLGRVMSACYKYQVKLESKFITVVIAMTILEGLGRRLNPDADIFLAATPYIAKAAAKMLLTDDF
jgi:aarF domain-containing kinase